MLEATQGTDVEATQAEDSRSSHIINRTDSPSIAHLARTPGISRGKTFCSKTKVPGGSDGAPRGDHLDASPIFPLALHPAVTLQSLCLAVLLSSQGTDGEELRRWELRKECNLSVICAPMYTRFSTLKS